MHELISTSYYMHENPKQRPKTLHRLIADTIACRFQINPGNLSRGLVSCTGAQFCGVAIIETKNRAMAIVEKLEQQLDIPEAVRIHWTGCPNSCGQVRNPPSTCANLL